MRRFAVICRRDEQSFQLKRQLREKLSGAGWMEDEQRPQTVFAIGGDGTFLFAVHHYLSRLEATEFLGIHTGTLGFFCDYGRDEIDQCVADVTGRTPQVEQARLLEIELPGSSRPPLFAVNEVRVENVIKTQRIDIEINGITFETFRGTGICLCTQLGSTAYNRSLGGAVVERGLPLLQLSEITGIHHRAYRSLGSSLILNSESRIRLSSASFEGAMLCYDHLYFHLDQEKEIRIRQSRQCLRIAHYRQIDYLHRLKILF